MFAMPVQVTPLSELISHLTTLPTLPVSVMVPVLLVAHTVVSEFVTPATVKLSMVMFTVSLLSAQMPLLTLHTKLYVPDCRFEMLDVGWLLLENATVVGPFSWLHVPAPLVGVFAFSVYVDGKQIVASCPAFAAVTACSTVMIVVSL